MLSNWEMSWKICNLKMTKALITCDKVVEGVACKGWFKELEKHWSIKPLGY